MKTLNLDLTFQPLGAGIAFEAFTFSGGEPHLRISETLDAADEVTITARVRSFHQLGEILLANDALQQMGVSKVHLLLPYFPAARQDRVMTAGEPLTVKIVANLINACGFESVTVYDPHSEVTPALLDRVKVVNNHAFVRECLQAESDYILISPDGGALKKIYKVAQALGGQPVVEASKRRDVHTGALTHFTVYAEDLEGKTCVVVDDICDGGGTFIGLAAELKKKNAGKLILVASHGLFSKGTAELATHYAQLYCSDSFSTHNNEQITQLKLTPNLLEP